MWRSLHCGNRSFNENQALFTSMFSYIWCFNGLNRSRTVFDNTTLIVYRHIYYSRMVLEEVEITNTITTMMKGTTLPTDGPQTQNLIGTCFVAALTMNLIGPRSSAISQLNECMLGYFNSGIQKNRPHREGLGSGMVPKFSYGNFTISLLNLLKFFLL